MMRLVFCWSLVLLSCISKAEEDIPCGTTGVLPVRRVIGGIEAAKGAWPWQALLINHRYYQISEVSPLRSYGGGSVITSKWILTASHIFDNAVLQASFRTKRWNRLLVILGLTKFPKTGEALSDTVFAFEPSDVILHENYDSETYDFDIALVKFGKALKVRGSRFIPDPKTEQIPFSAYIRPVCLPCMNSCEWGRNTFSKSECKKYANSVAPAALPLQQDVTVTGYGSTLTRDPLANTFKYPDNLQQADLTVLNDAICEDGLKTINKVYASEGHNVIAQYTERMICAIGKRGGNISDSCQGDSGGPLLKKVNSSNGSECWTQVGIVSWGLGCASTPDDREFIPGYYVNVASLMEWVLKKIDRLKIPPDTPSVCSEPTPPKNGFFSKNADKREVGSVITTACNAGYRAKGKRRSKCLPNSEWEPFPTCQGSWDSWTQWSSCSATCRGKKERTRTCKARECVGRNKQVRICNRLGCLPMCAPITAPLHGSIKVTPNPDVFRPDTIVEFFCNDGWRLKDGSPITTCQQNNKWSDERIPVCEATKASRCPEPSPPENGKISFSTRSAGSQISFECNDGYVMKGESSTVCDANGTWGTFPTCTIPVGRTAIFNANECLAPTAPENGAIEGAKEKYAEGEYVFFTCHEGFVMRGMRWAQCLGENEFRGEAPRCSERNSCFLGDCTYIEKAVCQCHSTCLFEGNCCQDAFVFCNTFPFS